MFVVIVNNISVFLLRKSWLKTFNMLLLAPSTVLMSAGFNCAESITIASWCHCKPDTVNISMDCFVKRFQPERWVLSCCGCYVLIC